MASFRRVLIAALIGLQLAAVGAVLAVTYVASETTLIGHAERLMRRAAADANRFTIGFLRPAGDAATLSQRLATSGVLTTGDDSRIARYFYEQLRGRPEFAGIYYGEADGDFLYVSRTEDEAAPFRTKSIKAGGAGSAREVSLTFHDAAFSSGARRTDPEDEFDPRARPWYAAAAAAGGPAWTDPYIFFSSQRPGITVATPVEGAGGATAGVVGIDIEIEAISRFLDTLELSEWGSVAILSRDGSVVAHRDPFAVQVAGADGPRFATMEEIMDAPLREAVAALPGGLASVDDENRPLLRYEADGEDWLAVFEPMEGGLTPWIVASYLPESDFLGALDRVRRNAVIIAAVIALATALIGLRIATLISRPVNALAGQAESIAAGSLDDTPLPPMHFRELGHMAGAMRAATASLREHRAREEAWAAEQRGAAALLEEKVAERTSALEAARARAETLTGEINHRIKNLFAVTGILVSAVARTAATPEEAGRLARARIDALARAHSTTTDGTSTDLAALLHATLAPYEETAEIEMEGPPVRLGRAAMTPFGLIVYELATNAAKYGALGAGGGRLAINWSVRGGELRLSWEESGAGRPEQGGPGFGSGMVGAMAAQLGAALSREPGEDGMRITLVMPLGDQRSA